jgi:hypothetical protein
VRAPSLPTGDWHSAAAAVVGVPVADSVVSGFVPDRVSSLQEARAAVSATAMAACLMLRMMWLLSCL